MDVIDRSSFIVIKVKERGGRKRRRINSTLFFIDINDIFDYDEISRNDRLFIMNFIERTSFLVIEVKERGGGKSTRANSSLFYRQ